MDLDEVVCNCMNITKGMIKEAVMNGATTVSDVMEATEAGTIFGACIDDIQRLTGYFATEKTE